MATRFEAILTKVDEAKAEARVELKDSNNEPLGIFLEVDFERRGVVAWNKDGDRFFFPADAIKPASDVLKYLTGSAT